MNGGIKMQVVYHKLFELLKEKKIMQKTFGSDLNINGGTMQKLRHNESVTTATIGKICEYLQCQPNDIMEVIYDADIAKANAERLEVEKQIAELQAKLKQM
jgi:DNA-binding Xre family transcriptional regulator